MRQWRVARKSEVEGIEEVKEVEEKNCLAWPRMARMLVGE